ncbi:hypothetical protein SKAU_G00156030 [Synaphobranchus kaupii]|uniref:Uncharacterized protein n=1 Tax=Synaphobranchus kaupii TaxID=118154 RepID=A0A9Q1FHJ7_SYNKA|nr:hypothetical protein SKAU_G00156030 [Synaphobranchus kaupii]
MEWPAQSPNLNPIENLNVNRQEAQGNGGWGVDGQTEKVCHHWGLAFKGREQASPQAKTVARPLPEDTKVSTAGTGAEAAVWWATAYKWSTSGNICLSACCCSGPGTSRPPPPATPPGAIGDGAAELAPSPRQSPLTLSMFSKPRFGGASGAAAKPNPVARKKPVEPHYGLCEDPASLQPHYGLCEDPASLQSHYGLCENHSTATEVPRTDLY